MIDCLSIKDTLKIQIHQLTWRHLCNRYEVVRDNWYNLLDPQIAEDLRSRRTYNERSVSGLLRALRNKKHHYQVILLISMVVLFQFVIFDDVLRIQIDNNTKLFHFQELSREIKSIYGRFPDKFADYWLSKFPKLLIHSWLSMHCVKNEPTFLKHYHKDYEFIEVIFTRLNNHLGLIWFYHHEKMKKVY